MKEFKEIINDKKYRQLNENMINKLGLNNIDELYLNDFDTAYRFLIKRFLNEKNIDTLRQNLIGISMYNPHIDFVKELQKRRVSLKNIEDQSTAQISHVLFKDKDVKRFLKKIEKIVKNPSFFNENLSSILSAIEGFANNRYLEIKIASSRGSRMMAKILCDKDNEKDIITLIDESTIKILDFYFDYLLPEVDRTLLEKSDEIPNFDIFIRLTNDYAKLYLDLEDDEYTPICTDFSAILETSYMRYGYTFIYDTLDQETFAILKQDNEERLDNVINALETFEKLKDTKTSKSDFLNNNPLKEFNDNSVNEYVEYLEDIIAEAWTDCVNIKNVKQAALSFFYFLCDALIYNLGANDGKTSARNIANINDKYHKHFNSLQESILFYENYEKEANRTPNYYERYDEFDTDVFKKLAALISFYTNDKEYTEEGKSFFYKMVSNRNDVIKKCNLFMDEKNVKFASKNEHYLACGSIASGVFDNEELNYTGVQPLWMMLGLYFKYICNDKRIKRYKKYDESIKRFEMYSTKNDESVLTEEEIEFIDRVMDEDTGISAFSPNNNRFFQYELKDELSTYKRSYHLTDKELGLMLASLKAIVDEENDGADEDEMITDEELPLYFEIMKRELRSRKRAMFVRQFYKDELNDTLKENKDLLKTVDALKNELGIAKNKAAECKMDVDKSIEAAKKEQLKSFKNTENSYKEEIKQLQERIEELQLQNDLLQNDNSKLERTCKRLTKGQQATKLSDVIGDLKVTLVGGRYEKLRELQNKYPNNIEVIIDPNFPDNAILKSDIVICLYNFLSHGTYYRVKKLMDIRNDRFDYCEYDNINLIENKITETILNIEK